MREDFTGILDSLRAEARLRQIPEEPRAGMIDFTGNDYMGLARDCDVQLRLNRSVMEGRMLFSSSASRLLSTVQSEYTELEKYLNEAYGKPALLFNSGYHANVGVVQALSQTPRTMIVADKLVHASIIDGIRLGGASYKRFAHNDLKSLRRILEKEHANYDNIWVIVESIYSMDGDMAPLREISEFKREFKGVRLYVDEAHGLGVRGDSGLGVCEELGIIDDVDLLIGTFGKACASVGAFVVAESTIRDYLMNFARSFIFSTALPPVNASCSLFMLRELRDRRDGRKHLHDLSSHLAKGLEVLTGIPNPSVSQIIPWIVGSNEKAVRYASKLRELGFIAMPIRRPTVAAGTERIRFSLNASMHHKDIDNLLNAIKEVVNDEISHIHEA